MGQESALPTPELRLVKAAQGGDQSAFAQLVRRSAPALERLALRMLGHRQDAEDATQEAVLYAWRSVSRFRGDARFHTWLYRIVVSRALDAIRRRRPADVLPAAVASRSDSPARQVEAADFEETVRAAVNALPPIQRATLLLRADHGLAYAEIAYVLGSTRNAVRSNLVAARKRLALELRGVVDLERDGKDGS